MGVAVGGASEGDTPVDERAGWRDHRWARRQALRTGFDHGLQGLGTG
jgi:hypothetical protein